jgi:hypothetical protein
MKFFGFSCEIFVFWANFNIFLLIMTKLSTALLMISHLTPFDFHKGILSSDLDHFRDLCDQTLRSRNEVFECAVDLQHGLK